jgi:hypothetical protein
MVPERAGIRKKTSVFDIDSAADEDLSTRWVKSKSVAFFITCFLHRGAVFKRAVLQRKLEAFTKARRQIAFWLAVRWF